MNTVQNIKNFYKELFIRLFDVVIHLAKQNLAFRGHRNENIANIVDYDDDTADKGN